VCVCVECCGIVGRKVAGKKRETTKVATVLMFPLDNQAYRQREPRFTRYLLPFTSNEFRKIGGITERTWERSLTFMKLDLLAFFLFFSILLFIISNFIRYLFYFILLFFFFKKKTFSYFILHYCLLFFFFFKTNAKKQNTDLNK